MRIVAALVPLILLTAVGVGNGNLALTVGMSAVGGCILALRSRYLQAAVPAVCLVGLFAAAATGSPLLINGLGQALFSCLCLYLAYALYAYEPRG